MTEVVETSIPALLRERASLQPDDTAYTFVDYERDPAGVAESLTWPQLYRRVSNVARELRSCAAPGDRAVISAPQSLDYIVGFLGALEAGLIAVPLSVPQGGVADERVDSVLRDAAPAAVLTTSSVVGDVAAHVTAGPGESAPAVLEVDRLDLDAPGAGSFGGFDDDEDFQSTAYLQYTSGSTRSPAGVMISYKNLLTNVQQITTDYAVDHGGVAPPDMTVVSWLPFYHDLGLIMGICTPVYGGYRTVLTSPIAFLERPARWMQLLASNPQAFSSAPNFAFELAARKTSDADMDGLDLGDVFIIQSGAERVNPTTIKRFTDRFAAFNLDERVIQPSYGLAEATLYVATVRPGLPPNVVNFEPEELTEGVAKRSPNGGGTPLVGYDTPLSPLSPTVRIVDPDTRTEVADGTTGEVWVHGDNVGVGYWHKPEDSERVFRASLAAPSPGTPEGPWLRTGDLGFVSEGQLFIVGRIKDLLIVYGRNHAPDDIEATISEITKGRCAAIAVPRDGVEELVAIVEFRKRGDSDEQFAVATREITSAISHAHGLAVGDLVLVAPGSIPVTTSGKIRRQSCGQLYRQNGFTRLDG
ncbi:AMP-binding protein [Mycolicibacterium parafortuitum]|uniref:Fatty-acid-AMP ligase FadD28 (Fatty-acid-AMP synthetase) (Fatty-acid-AMP synthase) [Mycobacterium tuberculosis H37Rv] n=1 Tax=Mycolicibacterium parafortuitum TaxID=39692 RepID=A0A375YMB8_MYCPF|nr:AMP-binding protein [Mycolicibacterium parafortuitum]ORB27094.1 acyl-CoA synthetase [Mycolicibacterium parafortuitum]SRX82231.1 Fatty-acid-AMP ligase FadD28 (fatty-acid-AMP synthetase) (fatty-acid-AMP synthase) [Mycobacterium tuberculosis H37Rv] [Mycolicibacterium parafortuitum]